MLDVIAKRKPFKTVDFMRLDEAKASDIKLNFISAKLRYQYSKIKIADTTGVQFVEFSEIAYIHSCSNYSVVVSTAGQHYTTSKTLKYWEEEINSSEFIRCHNSYLINKNEIRSIGYSENEIILKNGQRVRYSRSKKVILMNSL